MVIDIFGEFHPMRFTTFLFLVPQKMTNNNGMNPHLSICYVKTDERDLYHAWTLAAIILPPFRLAPELTSSVPI